MSGKQACYRCGKPTTSVSECYQCRKYPSDDALTGGRWVLVRGVNRWQATEPAVLLHERPVVCRDCGSTEVRQYLCEPCAAESKRRSRREHMRRVRAERRAA